MLEAAALFAPRTWLLPRLGPQLGTGLYRRTLQSHGWFRLTDRRRAVTTIRSAVDHDRGAAPDLWRWASRSRRGLPII